MSIGLTSKQEEVLDYIREYKEENGYTPTFKEIQERFRYSSVSSAWGCVQALRKKNFVDVMSNVARGIRLKD